MLAVVAMLVLGIETTCDETAAAVVERSEVRRQSGPARSCPTWCCRRSSEHAAFGGVVPEIAARAHVEALDRIIAKALADAGKPFDRRDRRRRRHRRARA